MGKQLSIDFLRGIYTLDRVMRIIVRAGDKLIIRLGIVRVDALYSIG